MKIIMLIGLCILSQPLLAAVINQSLLSGAFNLTSYIMEDYDPSLIAGQSICLSSKESSISGSASSVSPETVCFMEQMLANKQLSNSQK